ncbi:hypothetical protein JYU34_020708 [Plutella xylostella]|uniref:Peptidase M28 domain-containing protein n=1 Tax=Plutella xylostella TaxID=51655 RepID=A0ABQ7PUW8_PLUXY|nr:hypothetical protein JYU34_020708 [Plutella xylostella]
MKYKLDFSEDPTHSTYKNDGEKTSKLPCYYLAALFGFLFLLAYFASLIDDAMPTVVTDIDAGTTAFSEERSWGYLRTIVGDGPRVCGRPYHREQTEKLKTLLDDIAKEARQPVRVEWQIVSGDYWLDYKRPFTNYYDNSSNIVAMVEGDSGLNDDGTTNSSILFNCHYDSRPTSPGASDNALFCAVLVDVFSILSKSETKLRHNVVFLFNGAEENPLQAVPGFLKHPWSKGVTGLVNLDSAGINCKSLMFQVTDTRVASAYSASVPRPSAQAFGEVLFKSGIVPSDTDFRIFRDFGAIQGVDIAFSKMGHVYHTRLDSLETLKEGVQQHSGDMVLALARTMAGDPQFDTKAPAPTSAVYYDYLNLFMVTYSYTTAAVVDSLVVIFAFCTVLYYQYIVGFRKSTSTELLYSILSRVLSAAAGCGALWLVTALTVQTTIQLRYLSNGWIVVPIYWMPYLTAAVATSQLFDAWRCKRTGLTRTLRVAQAMAATRAIVLTAVVLLLLLGGTATLRYIVVIPLFLMSAASVVSLSVIKWTRIAAWQQILLEVTLAIPNLLFLFVIAIKINTLMLPIMGRTISTTPDYLVALLNMMTVILASMSLDHFVVCLSVSTFLFKLIANMFNPQWGIELLFPRARLWTVLALFAASGIELLFSRVRLWTVLTLFTVVCLVVSFIPFNPYRDSNTQPALQRHAWFHSEIFTYNRAGELIDQKSGIWMGKTEVNTPLNVLTLAAQKNITLETIDFTSDCSEFTYCNLPVITPRTIDYGIVVAFGGPTVASPRPALELISRTCEGGRCVLEFSFVGPHHMSLVLSPYPTVNLTSWSLESEVRPADRFKDRPLYFIHYGRNTYDEVVQKKLVSFEFEVLNSSDPIVDIAFSAHRTDSENEFTPEFKALFDAMPDYFNIEATLSCRFNYVF